MEDIELKSKILACINDNPFISKDQIKFELTQIIRENSITNERIERLMSDVFGTLYTSKELLSIEDLDELKQKLETDKIEYNNAIIFLHSDVQNKDLILKQLNKKFKKENVSILEFIEKVDKARVDGINEEKHEKEENNKEEVKQEEEIITENKKVEVAIVDEREEANNNGKGENNIEPEVSEGEDEDEDEDERDPPKSNTWYYGSMVLTGLVLAVLLYFVGKDFLFSEKPKLYSMANEVLIRKTTETTNDDNKLEALYFGDEVTVLDDNNTDWIKVKFGKYKGYAKKKYFASRNDYLLVDGVFADDFTRNYLDLWRYKVAILHYLLLNNACGNNLSEETKREIFVGSTSPPSIVSIQALPTANEYDANWVFKNRKNFNQNAPYNDLLFVVKEITTKQRTLVVCTFGDDEMPNIKIRKDYPYDTPIFSFWSGYNMNTGSEDIFFETYY